MLGGEFTSTRRSLLGIFTGAVAVPWSALAIGKVGSASDLAKGLPPIMRTPEGRTLSRFRYHNAEGFFRTVEAGYLNATPVMLYNVGIVLQLGLSSHLLDVGFDDAWCARHIGLHVVKSLRYANVTGLDANSPELARLVALLSPYSRWRDADIRGAEASCPFRDVQIKQLTRDLLERVREVTGHPRPRSKARSRE